MGVVFIQHAGCFFSQAISRLVLCIHLCICASKYRCTYTYLCINGSFCWGLSVGEMAGSQGTCRVKWDGCFRTTSQGQSLIGKSDCVRLPASSPVLEFLQFWDSLVHLMISVYVSPFSSSGEGECPFTPSHRAVLVPLSWIACSDLCPFFFQLDSTLSPCFPIFPLS